MKDIIFKGVGTAIVTPFLDYSIDYDEFKKLIEFQISNGVNAIIVCGTTGESATMTLDEKKYAIRFVVNTVAKRIPVIAGTGSNCTKSTIELSQYAQNLGVDGLLLVTPYYNKTTQEGAIKHFSAIANSTKLPIILYNVPSRTGMNLLPSTCLELSKIENIVGIKEASSNISQIANIASLCGNNFNIYSGNDDQILPVLSLGGLGVISVLSNIAPKQTCQIVNSFFDGDITTSTKLQLAALPLINNLFSEINPIPVKAALNLLGYQVGMPRLPLVEISDNAKYNLKQAMLEFGILQNH